MITAELPVKTVSIANVREHWSKRAKRAKLHRETARLVLRQHHRPIGDVTVRMVRVGARRMDSDNLAGALKACQDGIADWLGRDDADPSITWIREQQIGRPMVIVEIT